MKQTIAAAVFACLVLFPANASATATQDKTITRVVKMLQGMLDNSKTQGDAERTAYAKYICDCDHRSAEYKSTIETSTEEISLLANQIAQLKATNGELSTECAQLKAEMAANEKAQQDQTNLRNKQNAAFQSLRSDLTSAIGQLDDAIGTLAQVSADQTSETASAKDHTKFMSGYKPKYSPVSLLKAKSGWRRILEAAPAFMEPKKARALESFMQAPFTGSYTSQSVEVMGILKNMKDTFESNLRQATNEEAEQVKAFIAYIKIKKAEYDDMSDSYDKKQGELSTNDGSLAMKTNQKTNTEATLAEAEQFLDTTEKMCAAKKAEYSKRRMLQTQEEAAIAEAISILDSDAAFATFGSVKATSTGSLSYLQLKTIRKHSKEDDRMRSKLMQILSKVSGSKRLAQLKSMVQATNVFEVVLIEIKRMLALIVEEGKADKENLDFCNSERTTNDALIAKKTKSIEEDLKPKILSLINGIENPENGLKKQIADDEASLIQNRDTQKKSTEERTASNLVYRQDMKEVAEAKDLLKKAIVVLDAYYKKLDKALQLGLMQKHQGSSKNTPVPTSDSAVLKMEGESSAGKDVISKLSFILSETESEEQDEIADEKEEKRLYDEKMASLKGEESSLEVSLASLKSNLAKAEKELLQTEQVKKATEEERANAEAYLADIKPGCDFITANFDLRETNRAEEASALNKAIGLIKGTPVYLNYEAEVHKESLKNCVSVCADGEEKAKCKACLADVTVPAYCAGHKGTPGC